MEGVAGDYSGWCFYGGQVLFPEEEDIKSDNPKVVTPYCRKT
ncbi:hypothetical protein Hdeb2414_s0005g00173861 [Helianthus debilis subsp. tardiflorus]